MSDELMSLTKEELIARVSQAEAKTLECQIEGAVYRKQLIDCEELARRAEKTNNPQLLFGVLSQASLTLKEQNVKKWAEDWKTVWEADIKWLEATLGAVKEIKDVASKLDVEDEDNVALKMQLQALAKRALVQHAPSSVSR